MVSLIYILCNNFVSNQNLNCNLTITLSKCCSIDSRLKVKKYLLLKMLFIKI